MPEINHYNQSILSKEQKRELVLTIVGQLTWLNSFFTVGKDSKAGKLLTELSLATDKLYLSIAPKLTVYRAEVPYPYRDITIDVTQFPEGDPQCKHVMIELYWEVGGGGMDSGTPHRYVMCNKCCYHEKKHTIRELVSSAVMPSAVVPATNFRSKLRRLFGF